MPRVRRISSAFLVLGGGVLIFAALATRDGSAMEDETALPPAAPVIDLGPSETDETETQPTRVPQPPRVEAPSTQSLANPTGDSLAVEVRRSYPFTWPAAGPLTSEMGPWHTLGIDIGLEYGVDSPILAASDGRVEFSGGEVWETYGHHVILDHGGGMMTLYGHLYELFVEEGDMVRQGDLLGYGGDTGVSQGKHLHFEVRHGQALIDPQHVLPPFGEGVPEPLGVDCGSEAIVLESGAPLVIDFDGVLAPGAALSDVRLEKVAVSPDALPSAVSLETGRSVRFETTTTVVGTGEDDEYRVVTIAGEAELSCTIFVKTRSVSPSYYVRPTNTPTPRPPTATPIPPTATNTPTPTPTPTPTKTPFAASGGR